MSASADRESLKELAALKSAKWQAVKAARKALSVARAEHDTASLAYNRARTACRGASGKPSRKSGRDSFFATPDKSAGAEAVRKLGLEPLIATAADVRAAFAALAKAGHADHGGRADMAELVRIKDVALAYVDGRSR